MIEIISDTSHNKKNKSATNIVAKRRRIVKLMWKTFGIGMAVMLLFFVLKKDIIFIRS